MVKEMNWIKNNWEEIALNVLLNGGFIVLMYLILVASSWVVYIALILWVALAGFLYAHSGGSKASSHARAQSR